MDAWKLFVLAAGGFLLCGALTVLAAGLVADAVCAIWGSKR